MVLPLTVSVLCTISYPKILDALQEYTPVSNGPGSVITSVLVTSFSSSSV